MKNKIVNTDQKPQRFIAFVILALALLFAVKHVGAQNYYVPQTGHSGMWAPTTFGISVPSTPSDVGIPYTGNFQAVGAPPGTLVWTLNGSSPASQAGYVFTGSGTANAYITGNPTGAQACWTFGWSVTGTAATAQIQYCIQPGTLVSTSFSPASANINTNQTAQFIVSGNFTNAANVNVTAEATLTLSGCPSGTTVAATGIVSAGATAGTGCTLKSVFGSSTITASISVVSSSSSISIQTAVLCDAQQYQAYGTGTNLQPSSCSTSLAAIGGTGPYSWTVTSGTMPTGLTLNSNGTISGTPTTPAAGVSITFMVTDSASPPNTSSKAIATGIPIEAINTGSSALSINLGSNPISAGTSTSLGVMATYADGSKGSLAISQGGSGGAYIQSNNTVVSGTPGTSLAVSFSSNTTAGDAIIVPAGVYMTTISSVTDSQGNTYTQSVANGGNAIFVAPNIIGGADTVTVHFAASSSFDAAYILEYSGVLTSSPLDQATSATGTGTTANSGNITTTSANEILVGFCNGDYTLAASGANWNSRQTAGGNVVEDSFVSATGTYSAACTQSQSGNWEALIASYKTNAPAAGQVTVTSATQSCAVINTTGTPQVSALSVTSACSSLLTATLGSSSGTTTVNVTVSNPDTGLVITPPSPPPITIPGTQQFQAIGNKSGLPYNATWGISGSVATLSTTSGTSTVATCQNVGTATITASATVNGSGANSTATLPCTSGTAQVLNAASCSPTDIQTQLNQANASIVVVNVPSSPTACNWSTPLVFTVPSSVSALTIQGQTAVNCANAPGGATYTCNTVDNTSINDTVASNSPIFQMTSGSLSTYARITGFTFDCNEDGGNGSFSKGNGCVNIQGNSHNIRIDHNHFVTTFNQALLQMNGATAGVVDHNVCDMGTNQDVANCVRDFAPAYGDTNDFGDQSWAMSTPWGSTAAWYVEDNVFNGSAPNDCDDAGAMVFRYNTVNDAYLGFQNHATKQDAGGWRGCRALDVNHNYFTGPSTSPGNAAGGSKGGPVLAWGNIMASGYNHFFAPETDRNCCTNDEIAPPNGWGYDGVGGTGTASGSPWDATLLPGYPALDGVGRGETTQALNGLYWPNRKNSVTNTQSWPDQLLEPEYAFMNTLDVGDEGYINDHISQLNRDVYEDCGNPQNGGGTVCGGSFNGTQGTGYGLLASRPSTCTAGPGGTYGGSPTGSYGVAYFATDANSGLGELYVCTATNTWTAVYEPTAHPSSLQSYVPTGGSGTPVVVNWALTHQVIDGFGGNDVAMFPTGFNMTSAQLAEIFGTTGTELGLSVIRSQIPNGPSSLSNTGTCTSVSVSCEGALLSDLVGAASYGARIIVTPFGYPAAYTTNGSVSCSAGSGSGTLATAHYQDYANWTVNFIKSLSSLSGVTVYAVNADNEPEYCDGTAQDSAVMTDANLDTYIKSYLGPTLASNSLTPIVFSPDAGLYADMASFPTCETDSSCASYLGAYDYHDYGAFESNGPGPGTVAAQPSPSGWISGKKFWVLEGACTPSGGGPNWCTTGFSPSWANALFWASDIDQKLAVDNVGLYTGTWWFYVDTPSNNGLGLVESTTLRSGDVATVSGRAYVIAQYARFVRPGYFRIDCTHIPQGGVSVSCYSDESTHTSIVVTNYTSSPVALTFNISSAPTISTLTPYISTATQALAAQSAVSLSGNSFSYTIPAQSVTTFAN